MKRSTWLALLFAAILYTAPLVYYVQLQASNRKHSIGEACNAQNVRNRNTINEYDTRIAVAAPKLSRAQRAQLKQSREFTVGLINALQPYQDCAAVLRKAGF